MKHPVFIILILFVYLQFNPLKLHLNTIFRPKYLGITRAKLTFNVVHLKKFDFLKNNRLYHFRTEIAIFWKLRVFGQKCFQATMNDQRFMKNNSFLESFSN